MVSKPTIQLDEQDHKLLTIWASDCAERVLINFEILCPQDERPRKAIDAARAWTHGMIKVGDARDAAFASHAAARDISNPAAKYAARAAGHAAAAAHVVSHAYYAAEYAVKAFIAAQEIDKSGNEERKWQYLHLPVHLRKIIFPESK
jgi:hypothetical protein